MDKSSLEALADRLEECHKTVIAASVAAKNAGRHEEAAMAEDMISLGLQMALYLTLLIEGKTNDKAPLHEVREYCDIAEELGREFENGTASSQ